MRAPVSLAPAFLVLVLAVLLAGPGRAADRSFAASDGTRLHYIDAGPSFAPTIVFVPGWTMPAWIFERQIDFFSRDFHVIAFDPRGQGDSDVPPNGYEPFRRGADIADLFRALGNPRALLVGWSLGVLDSLAYVHQFGDGLLSGMVLVDNSVGEEPAPIPGPRPPRHAPVAREAYMASFVRSMFHRPQPDSYLDALTSAALRTPPAAAAALLAYPVPRSYWRDAIYAVHKPILYIVRPGFSGQAANLEAHHPGVETEVWPDSGHAMFIDQGNRFNAAMLTFIQTQVQR